MIFKIVQTVSHQNQVLIERNLLKTRMKTSKVILKIEAISESGWIGPQIFQEKLLDLSEAEALTDQLDNLCQSSQKGIPIFHQDKIDPFILQFQYLKIEIIDDPKMIQAFKSLYPEGKTGSYDLASAILLYYLLHPKSPPIKKKVVSVTGENNLDQFWGTEILDGYDEDSGQPNCNFGAIMSPSMLNSFHNTRATPVCSSSIINKWKSVADNQN